MPALQFTIIVYHCLKYVASSMRIDGRKDIQLAQSAWSIYIQRLKLASYPLSREMNMKYNILARSWKFKKRTDGMAKYKITATKNRKYFAHF